MSRQLDLTLLETLGDEESEEYFSTNPSHVTVPPQRAASRNRARKVAEEPSVIINQAMESIDLDNKPHEDNQEDELDWIGRDDSHEHKTPITAYLNAFFMTIATVLGTGILGLPVKLSQSGFNPLVATYTIVFIMQCALIVFLVEVMQRARVEFQSKRSSEMSIDGVPLYHLGGKGEDLDNELQTDDNTELDTDLGDFRGNGALQASSMSKGEDLHSLAKAYLPTILQYLFDGSLTVHFLALLITYTLAASEAYGQLFGLHQHWIWLAIPFVGLLAPAVILGSKYLTPVISIFTFSKAGLLVLMVVITAIASHNVDRTVTNDWRFIGRPFLIGTVALGGCYNILPVAFEKVRFHTRHIKIFTASAVAGLTLVYLFNLGWCYFVLRIVPQMPSGEERPGEIFSLYEAEQNGQISTVPLVSIIRRDQPKFRWIATVIMLFTMVSITVSFIVNSMGWKHYAEGLLEIWRSRGDPDTTNNGPSSSTFLSKLRYKIRRAWLIVLNLPLHWKRSILFTASFAFVLAMALSNPKSFLKIMEKVVSLAANGTAAAICLILHRSRFISPVSIPWVLPPLFYKTRWVVAGFFILAMVYNLVATIAEAGFHVKYL